MSNDGARQQRRQRRLAAQCAREKQRGRWPLHSAVRANNLDEIRCLLDAGAPASQEDDKGKKPLEWAAEFDYLDAAQLLLSVGDANPDGGDIFVHPLSIAICCDSVRVARLLLAAGASPNRSVWLDTVGTVDFTPLHTAVRRRRSALIRMLCDYNADQSAKDDNGQTAFSYAHLRDFCVLPNRFCGAPDAYLVIREIIRKRENNRMVDLTIGIAPLTLPVLLIIEIFSWLTHDESQVDRSQMYVPTLHWQWSVATFVKKRSKN